VPAGVYRETVWIPKSLTLSGEPGAIIEGEDRHRWIIVAAHDVTIEGFEMRGSVNERYRGGITQNVGGVSYNRLTVRNNTLAGASYAAIATWLGSGHQIVDNVIRDNGALGIRIDSGSGHYIAGNTIFNTNQAELWDAGWEAGGIKVSGNDGGARHPDRAQRHLLQSRRWGLDRCRLQQRYNSGKPDAPQQPRRHYR
jgi:parallel beta-helix repeat protein